MTGATNLDTSFDADGQARPSQGFVEEGRAIAIQPDGKIVVAGFSDGLGGAGEADFLVVRYNTDGSRDTSFSGDGRINFSFGPDLTGVDRGGAVALQADGKIVVAGMTDAGGGNVNNFAVARLLPNGELDDSFDGDGRVTIDFNFDDAASAVAVQPDGRIVVAGQSAADTAVARLLTNGSARPRLQPGRLADAREWRRPPADQPRQHRPRPRRRRRCLTAACSWQEPATTGRCGHGGAEARCVGRASRRLRDQRRGLRQLRLSPTRRGSRRCCLMGAWSWLARPKAAADFAVARLAANGAPDTTFNLTGRATVDMGGPDLLRGSQCSPTGAWYSPAPRARRRLAEHRGRPSHQQRARGHHVCLRRDATSRSRLQRVHPRRGAAGQRAHRPRGRTTNNEDMYTVRLIGGPPPSVSIVTPTTAITTTSTSPFLALAGTAADSSGLTNDRVDDRPRLLRHGHRHDSVVGRRPPGSAAPTASSSPPPTPTASCRPTRSSSP